jgi:hypothetical protein
MIYVRLIESKTFHFVNRSRLKRKRLIKKNKNFKLSKHLKANFNFIEPGVPVHLLNNKKEI